jgi:hypothetical protein
MPVGVAKNGFWWNNFPAIAVFPTLVDQAVANLSLSEIFTATGGSSPSIPYTFSYTGDLTPGTSLDSAGNWTGSPTTPGTYNFRIIATDANGKTGYRDYTQEVIIDRALSKSNNVLIVWDPNSVQPGRYSTDVNPATLAANISAREISLGFVPTTLSSYAAFTALTDEQIATYAHIWDVGYDTLITPAAEAKYSTCLANDGAIFFLGENGYFIARDNDIDSFIESVGGGTISIADSHYYGAATIQPGFLLGNPNPNVTFYDVADFTTYGSGTPMVVSNSGGLVQAVVWETLSLSSRPSACLCVILDVNWLDNVFIPSIQPNLIDNVSVVLNQK